MALNAVFGGGTGPVLLRDVKCTGFEHRLLDCPNPGIEQVSNCQNSQDAGVICSTGNMTSADMFCLKLIHSVSSN